MATWDSADLLDRCKRIARRPASDDSMADADWYALLTEAEAFWKPVIVAVSPWNFVSAPTAMSTADSGETYTFTGSIVPIWTEVYTHDGGRPLVHGAYWDSNADYTWEGSRIRITKNRTKSWSGGPVSRHVVPPVAVDASTDSTIQPAHARLLLVYHAVKLWAERQKNLERVAILEAQLRQLWRGDPDPTAGMYGLLGMYKTQNLMMGSAAHSQSLPNLSDIIDDGGGYAAFVAS